MSTTDITKDRSMSPGSARVVEEMVVMLGEMDIHEVRASELARRAGVAIPTVYYNFHSLTDIIAEATVLMLNRYLAPFGEHLADMSRAVRSDDAAAFRDAATSYVQYSWSMPANEGIHRLAPLISYFRRVAPEDVRLRAVQARELADFIEVLHAAQSRGWISADDDATAFAVVHCTCVVGQAVFWHPAFGPLTAIEFSQGIGRLRYQTALRDNLRAMSLNEDDAQ
ncbi:MAG: TetR/AcrR family transcriptional regulator [Actinomycetota bacterium]|nr:TetR/AcrR family transcriptional regulator [Actinomycetota bacterium]